MSSTTENKFVSDKYKTHYVKGYEELKKLLETLENDKSTGSKIFLYFTGEKLSTGVSWCPDCVKVEPNVASYLKKNDTKVFIDHLVIVDVGNREYWKNKTNPFRTDFLLNIQNLPTISRWKGPQKLTGDELADESLLSLLFEDAEDYL